MNGRTGEADRVASMFLAQRGFIQGMWLSVKQSAWLWNLCKQEMARCDAPVGRDWTGIAHDAQGQPIGSWTCVTPAPNACCTLRFRPYAR